MNIRLLLASSVSLLLLAACGGGTSDDRAVPTQPATNNDGSPATQVISPVFDASAGNLPFPINLLFAAGGNPPDLTLDPPVDDPNDFSDPVVVLSALDGFSTIEPWVINFVDQNRAAENVAPASVVPGGSVRMFQVAFDPLTLSVLGIVRELTPGVDFTATASGSRVVILPLRPLQELTTYMAVLTDGVRDTAGNDATPDQQYFIGKRQAPLVDANGNSTDPLLPNATARALEPLRQIINTQENALEAFGVPRGDIVLSFTATTQAITPVLKILRSIAQPAPVTTAPTGLTTAAIGAFGLADIHIGVITLPYYLGVPSAQNPTAPLNQFWTAAPGAYIPPFDQFGLDPTSTNVTVANPFPVLTDMQTVPILVTVPNATSGMSKPAGGWPVAIFQHGLGGNRTQALAIADAFASIGYATVAMDIPLHGVVPAVDPTLAPFYVENTPFGAIANERTFDVDYINNQTGAAGPDGVTDASGSHYVNLLSLLTTRDNLRQAEADLSILAVSLPGVDLNGDTIPDFDSSNIAFSGLSLGAIAGVPFLAVEPTVTRGALSVPGGGLARMLNASQAFGPRIRAGLAAAGVEPGTADFEAFLTITQTAIDSGDPINWISEAAQFNAVLLHEVINDTVIPNSVATAPLSGTEPLIRVAGLTVYNSTISDPVGLRAAGRFVPPASHGSLLSPSTSPAATAEMQSQFASFIATFGTTVVVSNPATMASP